MECPNCQFDNPQAMKFCGECGAKLETICPECNYSNPPQFKFCGECGQNLTLDQQVLPIDYAQPQTYTPKFLADKILVTRSSIEGERKLVTVLFADVANYTAMSENLDPEEVHQIMDRCFKILDELKLKALYAPGYHYLGELYADFGQKDKALKTLKKAEKMFKDMGMDYWLTKSNEALDRF